MKNYLKSFLIIFISNILVTTDAFTVPSPKLKSTIHHTARSSIPTILHASLKEPEEQKSNFGRKSYWNECYESEREYTWYASWNDIQPFFTELVPLKDSETPRVLLPGIGNDSSMVDMFDYGYTQMSAFDYASEGVDCAKDFFGDRDCDLQVADARNLVSYEDDSYDAILEKGTLDAIYLSGANDKELAAEHLKMAVDEMHRVLKKGGVVMSITAACADAVKDAFDNSEYWQVIRDGSFYVTEDGYTSNNIDATILVYEKISK